MTHVLEEIREDELRDSLQEDENDDINQESDSNPSEHNPVPATGGVRGLDSESDEDDKNNSDKDSSFESHSSSESEVELGSDIETKDTSTKEDKQFKKKKISAADRLNIPVPNLENLKMFRSGEKNGESTRNLPVWSYLVVIDKDDQRTWHFPIRDSDGKINKLRLSKVREELVNGKPRNFSLTRNAQKLVEKLCQDAWPGIPTIKIAASFREGGGKSFENPFWISSCEDLQDETKKLLDMLNKDEPKVQDEALKKKEEEMQRLLEEQRKEKAILERKRKTEASSLVAKMKALRSQKLGLCRIEPNEPTPAPLTTVTPPMFEPEDIQVKEEAAEDFELVILPKGVTHNPEPPAKQTKVAAQFRKPVLKKVKSQVTSRASVSTNARRQLRATIKEATRLKIANKNAIRTGYRDLHDQIDRMVTQAKIVQSKASLSRAQEQMDFEDDSEYDDSNSDGDDENENEDEDEDEREEEDVTNEMETNYEEGSLPLTTESVVDENEGEKNDDDGATGERDPISVREPIRQYHSKRVMKKQELVTAETETNMEDADETNDASGMDSDIKANAVDDEQNNESGSDDNTSNAPTKEKSKSNEFMRALQAENNILEKRNKSKLRGLVENEASEEELDDGVGDYGTRQPRIARRRTLSDEREERLDSAMNQVTEDDLKHIVDDLSDNEGEGGEDVGKLFRDAAMEREDLELEKLKRDLKDHRLMGEVLRHRRGGAARLDRALNGDNLSDIEDTDEEDDLAKDERYRAANEELRQQVRESGGKGETMEEIETEMAQQSEFLSLSRSVKLLRKYKAKHQRPTVMNNEAMQVMTCIRRSSSLPMTVETEKAAEPLTRSKSLFTATRLLGKRTFGGQNATVDLSNVLANSSRQSQHKVTMSKKIVFSMENNNNQNIVSNKPKKAK